MKLNRVLVIHKGASLTESSKLFSRVEWLKRRRQHETSLYEVLQALEASVKHVEVIDREHLRHIPSYVDLIVTVGGDGTVLAASHALKDTPVLGVNSMPGISVGHFCISHSDKLKAVLDQIANDKIKPSFIPRMQILSNGRPICTPVLNDILFTSNSPAESVYYWIQVGRKKEFQRGSGLWISGGPGSSAGFSSARGKSFSITSNVIKYLVREPCPLPKKHYSMLKGSISPRGQLTVTSVSEGGTLYVDGSIHCIGLKVGQSFSVTASDQPLPIFLSKKQLGR